MEFILILLIHNTAAFRWFLLLPDFVFCQSSVGNKGLVSTTCVSGWGFYRILYYARVVLGIKNRSVPPASVGGSVG